MKTVYAQRGAEGVGKTTTIRMLFDLLQENGGYSIGKFELTSGKDVRAVVSLRKLLIGIESYGDPWKKAGRLEPSLRLFARLPCDVIICAARSAGGTADAVARLKDERYRLVWRERAGEAGKAAQVESNRSEAQWLFQQIRTKA